jgi:hypothetical protein
MTSSESYYSKENEAMSEDVVDEQVYEISFPQVRIDGGGRITASIVCKGCGASIPLNKKGKKKKIRSAEGIKCKRCPRAYFFPACGHCKRLIGLDDIKLSKMNAGGIEPCPSCGVFLIWPLPPGPVS